MTKKKSLIPAMGEFLLYTTADGHIRIETRMQGETVWLTQKQLAELFQTSIPNINMHIKNIFEEGELSSDSVIQESLIAAADGKSYRTKFYNLDMIISVGYRIKSHVATHFRLWATQRLREYIIKGFALDDQRLKQAGGGNYFDELLARIRDKRMIAKAIIFKVTNKLVRPMFQAFQGNVATYLVSVLANQLGDRFDLDKVWQQQDLSHKLKQQLTVWAKEVHSVLHKTSNGRMISEWAKKAECWEQVLETSYSKPLDGIPEVK